MLIPTKAKFAKGECGGSSISKMEGNEVIFSCGTLIL